MPQVFRPGDRVCICRPLDSNSDEPLLPTGTVVYVRMMPHDLFVPDVYSVRLDHKADAAAQGASPYVGTIIPAYQVIALVTIPTVQEFSG